MSIKYIIKLIEEFCFNYGDPFNINHKRFKADFSNFLRRKGCRVIEEYELIFDNVAENGEIIEQKGFIDFFVFFENKKIAIEFDKGNRLRLKSIAKLLQSSADVLIGIVRGNQTYNVQFSNLKRIKWVMKKLQIFSRILLIVMATKSYHWI